MSRQGMSSFIVALVIGLVLFLLLSGFTWTSLGPTKEGSLLNTVLVKLTSYDAPDSFATNAEAVEWVVARAEEEYKKWDRGSLDEDDPQAREMLDAYWQASGYNPSSPTGEAWSAAFISYVTNQELKSAAHHVYIEQARAGQNPRWHFVSPAEREIAVGDVICNPRSGDTPSVGGSYRAHCDIVVEIDGSSAYSLGGNVGDTVARSCTRLEAGKLTSNRCNGGSVGQPFHAVLVRSATDTNINPGPGDGIA